MSAKGEGISESLIEIDENSLDEEWLKQPTLYIKFATQLANAKLDHAEAKSHLEVVKAEVDLSVRKAPSEFGVTNPKPTEKTIEAVVLTHPDVLDAVKELNQSKHRVDLLEAAVGALDHRKRALENLVTLFCQSYWAEPRTSEPLARERLEDHKKRSIRKKGQLPRNPEST